MPEESGWIPSGAVVICRLKALGERSWLLEKGAVHLHCHVDGRRRGFLAGCEGEADEEEGSHGESLCDGGMERREVSVSSVRRLVLLVGSAVAIGVAGAALWFSAAGPGPPNVLLVLWDTVRADHMSLYGHDRPTTPRLDAFAQGSVVYENAVSPGMWTVPSHGSMFTGLAPSTHGAGFEWRWLDHHHTTFAEHFQDNGYETFAFSANPNLSKRGANLLQGFDLVQTSWNDRWFPLVQQYTRRKLIPQDTSTEISPAFAGKRPGVRYYNGGIATGRAMMQWLNHRPNPDKPWLVYLNYMEAHKPRVPAPRFRQAVMNEAERRLALETNLSFISQLAYGYGVHEYSPEEIEAAAGVYDACIRELDHFTGNLLEALEERGELDNTIVVLTSDHGESLGEHHRFGHRSGVYQTLLHVPLVVHFPRKLSPGRVSEPVTTQDIFGTLTELAGLPHPEVARSSLPISEGPRPMLFSEVLNYDHKGLALARKTFPEIAQEGWGKTYRTVRAGAHKLLVDQHGDTELYDLASDPLETKDLAEQSPEVLLRLTEAIEARWAALPTYDPALRTPKDKPVIQAREKAMLEVLGYVTDDEAP